MQVMTSSSLGILLILLLICSVHSVSGESAISTPEGSWIVDRYADGEGAFIVPLGVQITAQFSAGNLTGNAGCNEYSSSYILNSDSLTIKPVNTSRSICKDTAMIQEQAYFRAIRDVSRMIRNDSILLLLDADNTTLVSCRNLDKQQDPLYNKTFYLSRYWNGTGLVDQYEKTESSIQFLPSGEISGKAGCNLFSGSYTRYADMLTFGKISSRNLACDEKRMVQERAVLKILSGTVTYEMNPGGMVLRDKTGRVVAEWVMTSP